MKYNQFNSVAPFYDGLVQLVFGNTLYEAQIYFLNFIPEGSKVLIVGGGTGKILQHDSMQKAGHIDYVELSSKMLERAKQNGSNITSIEYIQKDFFQHQGTYDFVICNFFLDCFDHSFLTTAVNHLRSLCHANSKILATDFQPSVRLKYKMITWLMLTFFKASSNLKAKQLHDIPKALSRCFKVEHETDFLQSFAFSHIYRPITSL